MTAVETSPDLRRARVYVSVLGDEADRDRTLAGLTSHGLLQAEIARELRMKRTPTLEFVYDESIDSRDANQQAARRGRRRLSTVATAARDQVLTELREADKLLLTRHENPDGDALGSLLAMHMILDQLGKDSVMYMAAGRVPAALGVPQPGSTAWWARRPTTWPSGRSSSSTAGTSTGCRSTSSSRTA